MYNSGKLHIVPQTLESKTKVVEFIKTPSAEVEDKFPNDNLSSLRFQAKTRAKRNLSELLYISASLDEKALKEIFDPYVMFELLKLISMRIGTEKVQCGGLVSPFGAKGVFYRVLGEALVEGHNIRNGEFDLVKCEFSHVRTFPGSDEHLKAGQDINSHQKNVFNTIASIVERYLNKNPDK